MRLYVSNLIKKKKNKVLLSFQFRFFFNFSKKKIGFYKISFRFFYFSSIPRIATHIPHIPLILIPILCIPTPILCIPLIPFPDSSFQLLQIASVLQISESKRCYNVIPSVHYFHLITKMSVDLQICIRVPIEYL